MKDFSLPRPQHSALHSALVILGLLGAATACGLLFAEHLSLASQAMLYVLAVVMASYFLDRLASILCAVSAVVALNFFFVPPRWTLAVDSQEHLVALGTLLLVALVISHLVARLQDESGHSRLSAWRASQLQDMAMRLAHAESPQQVRQMGQAALDAAFAGPAMLALTWEQDAQAWAQPLAPEVRDAMLCSMREKAAIGPGTGRWPGLNAWYLPLVDENAMHGAACVMNVQASDNDGREHAQALSALLGQALQRLRLTTSMQQARSDSDRQQVQSTMLAAISHDLRTPLAAVIGAASALQTQHDKLDATEQQRLLGSIVSEASYLSELTENTLQLVQLSSTDQALHRDWESMEEIVGSVLARLRQRDSTRRIRSKLPDALPLVRVDPVLLAQLISNLLDNALKYSSDAVDLVITQQARSLQLAVKDRGAGIAPQMQEDIFLPYRRDDHSGQRGAGLGLALCRAIAQAHCGTLTVYARKGGGSSFVLSLPLQEQPRAETA